MFRKRTELVYCFECKRDVEIIDVEPAVDRRGRRHVNYHGTPAVHGSCVVCGAKCDDILYAPWSLKWTVVAFTCVFFMGLSALGVYLFGYWSWKDYGGFAGWPGSAYFLSGLFSVCGAIMILMLNAWAFGCWRYLWVKRRNAKPSVSPSS